MIGTTISHYKILAKLGGGGMGVVYKAEDTKLKRFVALKFLPFDLTRDDEAKERFVHEAQTASALDHPNICTIYEIDETEDGQMFIAMAYYDGETLKKRMAKGEGRGVPIAPRSSPFAMPSGLPVVDAIDVAIQIAQGLARAHEAGITHRDIKPANVMITNRGEVKIVDFGLAKLAGRTKITKSGTTMGTAAYMSPEQAQGAEVDHRTDIWSLGVVLYEMLTGQLPFSAEYELALMYSIVSTDPKPVRSLRSEVSVGLEQIVNKALAKKPKERYQQTDEVLADLKALESGTAVRRPSRAKPTHPVRSYLIRGIAAVVVLLIALALYFWKTAEVEATQVSIAVLPLKSFGGQLEDEWFRDSMTDALITDLAKIGNLTVISLSSAMKFKDTDKSIPEIARELGVNHVLDCSILRIGNKVRISPKLIEAKKDKHIWVDSYEREFGDILALESEIAQTVANQVKVRLTLQEQARFKSVRPVNSEAYEAYLKGRYYWNKRTGEGMIKAIEYFEQAITKDSNYAPAYAGLADTYVLRALGYGPMPAKEAFAKAKTAALKALEIDSLLAEAHTSLGYIAGSEWEWERGEREFKRAVAINPNYATAHQWYAQHLTLLGRFDEAIAEVKRAHELDPLSMAINTEMGWPLFFARRYDEAITQWRRALELDPNFALAIYNLGLAYTQKGMYKEAIASYQRAISLDEASTIFYKTELAYTYAVSGQKDQALKILNEFIELSRQGIIQDLLIAIIYVGLGDKEKALEWLEKSYEKREDWLTVLKVEPTFDSLRSEPRFGAILKKMGLE